MNINIENSACFTGHRPNKLYGYDPSSEGNKKLLWNLRDIIIDHIENESVYTFITGMALGIDQWAAIPCINHSSKWNDQSQKEWKYIVDACDYVYYVSEEEYTAWCMQKRNEWMVDNSKFVIAVWDGTKGGTGNCVNYAKKKDKLIATLNPITYEINY